MLRVPKPYTFNPGFAPVISEYSVGKSRANHPSTSIEGEEGPRDCKPEKLLVKAGDFAIHSIWTD